MRLFHGTSSAKALAIIDAGFLPGSYFTASVGDALFYAATGGEEDLQRREEEWEADNGYPPREDYGSDTFSMMRDLFAAGEHPAIIVVELDESILATGRQDSGAEGALCFDQPIGAEVIARVIEVDWERLDLEDYDPVAEASDPPVHVAVKPWP